MTKIIIHKLDTHYPSTVVMYWIVLFPGWKWAKLKKLSRITVLMHKSVFCYCKGFPESSFDTLIPTVQRWYRNWLETGLPYPTYDYLKMVKRERGKKNV